MRVYCDMMRSCGGVSGGWMIVISFDMDNPSHSCPSGLQFFTNVKRRYRRWNRSGQSGPGLTNILEI